MHTQELVWTEIGKIWRAVGRLEADNRSLRRDMRDKRAKAGLPLWVHIAGMAVISAMSALGLVRPEVALSIMRLFGKALAG